MGFRKTLPLLGFGIGVTIVCVAAYAQTTQNLSNLTEMPTVSATEAPMTKTSFVTQVWVDDLDWPWALEFDDTGRALLTEKSGALYRIEFNKTKTRISGTPSVLDNGQGGLLDVAYGPNADEDGWVYMSYSHELSGGSGKAMTRLVRGKIDNDKWVNQEVLFEAKPEDYVKSRVHYGSRITFDDARHVYFSIGDRGQKDMAQNISKPNGKIHRLNLDGSIPEDNPFIGETDYPSIFSYGNRNPQGLIHTNGKLWSTEHGPKGGYELNEIVSGANYGWPKISYGRNYSGTELTPYTHMAGMEQPVSMWKPSIAACGLDVYNGAMFAQWRGNLMAGALKYQELRMINLDNGRYKGEEIILKDQGRVRDVTTGPDGAIYVVTENPGQIIRIHKE